MLRAVAAAAATSMAAPSPTGGQMATEWRLDIGCKVLKPGDWLYNSCEYVPPNVTHGILALPVLTQNVSRRLDVRAELMIEQLTRHGMPYRIIQGHRFANRQKDDDLWDKYYAKVRLLIANVREALRACEEQTRHELCLILDDDARLHPHLDRELRCTLCELPSHWNVFHLCPGFTWGHFGPDEPETHFHFHPEFFYPLAQTLRLRFFEHWPTENGWVGAPTAFIIKRRHARHIRRVITV